MQGDDGCKADRSNSLTRPDATLYPYSEQRKSLLQLRTFR